jgi:mono/diheme cytochrome c family protein
LRQAGRAFTRDILSGGTAILAESHVLRTNPVRSRILSAIVLVAGAALVSAAPNPRKNTPAQAATTASGAQAGSRASADQGQVERGKYLVEQVAKCPECHTPRDSNGELDKSRWLEGASIWIMPVHPDQNWAERAPALAGFPGYTEAQGERILEQGVGPNGLPIRPPMHIYHMKHEDAVAIIAYLKSLTPGSSPQ